MLGLGGKWTWLRLATAAAGLGAGALAAFVPSMAPVAGPVAAGLIGLALKGPGQGDPAAK